MNKSAAFSITDDGTEVSTVRLKAPGLTWVDGVPYWRATRRQLDAGYKLKSMRQSGTDDEIRQRCAELTKEANDWIATSKSTDLDVRADALAPLLTSLAPLRGGNYFDQLQASAQKRARARDREYTLPEGWARARYIKVSGMCELSGMRMHQDRRSRSPFMPTIDRINSDLGYTPENCRLVCYICNAAKGAFTDREFYHMCKKAVSYKRSK